MNLIKSFANQVLDLRAKKVEIELEINKTLSVKEIAERDAKLALENVEAIKKDIRELDEVLSGLIHNSSSISDTCKSLVTEYLETIREASVIVSDYLVAISQLQKDIIEAKEQLEWVKHDQKLALDNVVNETSKLATMKDDLDIYRKRLQTKYTEAGAGELILSDSLQ